MTGFRAERASSASESTGVRTRQKARGVARDALNSLPLSWQQAIRRRRNRSRPLPVMSIGLLFGDSPWALEEQREGRGPIMTAADVSDASAAFVADPFAVRHADKWHLFFEVMNRDSGKGEIAHATSHDLSEWAYDQMVLVEPFHLSYPAIYFDDGEFWMVPETWESGQVRLYRAAPFPSTWVLDTVLLDGVAGTDPTLFRTPDGWSMLLCSAEGVHNQTLLRYEAPSLKGPWHLAADSPLVEGDASQARPGGHCFTQDGVLYRLGQDCSTRYGERLRAFSLSQVRAEGGRDVLAPTGQGWRARGGHHADFHVAEDGSLIAFVDGEA